MYRKLKFLIVLAAAGFILPTIPAADAGAGKNTNDLTEEEYVELQLIATFLRQHQPKQEDPPPPPPPPPERPSPPPPDGPGEGPGPQGPQLP